MRLRLSRRLCGATLLALPPLGCAEGERPAEAEAPRAVAAAAGPADPLPVSSSAAPAAPRLPAGLAAASVEPGAIPGAWVLTDVSAGAEEGRFAAARVELYGTRTDDAAGALRADRLVARGVHALSGGVLIHAATAEARDVSLSSGEGGGDFARLLLGVRASSARASAVEVTGAFTAGGAPLTLRVDSLEADDVAAGETGTLSASGLSVDVPEGGAALALLNPLSAGLGWTLSGAGPAVIRNDRLTAEDLVLAQIDAASLSADGAVRFGPATVRGLVHNRDGAAVRTVRLLRMSETALRGGVPDRLSLRAEGVSAPVAQGLPGPEVQAAAIGLGLAEVESEATLDYEYDAEAGEASLTAAVVERGLAAATLRASFEGPGWGVGPGGAGSALREASLTLDDRGALEALFALKAAEYGASPEQMRREASGAITLAAYEAGAGAGRGARHVGALSRFAAKGGTLRVELSPEAPLTLDEAARSLAAPDAAAQLGLAVTWRD